MKQWIGHTSNNQKALLLSQAKRFLFHSKQVAFPPFQINKLFSHKAKPSVLMWWNGKFEFGKELYKVEKRKIVRGIILAILLICTVFLVYSIKSIGWTWYYPCSCCYSRIYCIRAKQKINPIWYNWENYNPNTKKFWVFF